MRRGGKMGIWDYKPKPKRTPPKPSNKIKKANIAKLKHPLRPLKYIPFSPQGFKAEPRRLPTQLQPRPMSVQEKKEWQTSIKRKSAERTKLRTRLAKRRSRNTRKLLSKTWHRIW